MGRYLRLCAVILSYEPLFTSMGLHPVLWTLIPLYGPSSHSMDHYSAMCRYFGLCAVISVYVLLFCSMERHLRLCAVIRFYGPSSHSMSRRHRSMSRRTALTATTPSTLHSSRKIFSIDLPLASSSISLSI